MDPFGPDCDLQGWGLKLAERGGKNVKKRTIVATAGSHHIRVERVRQKLSFYWTCCVSMSPKSSCAPTADWSAICEYLSVVIGSK
jgi:hypothetical protein